MGIFPQLRGLLEAIPVHILVSRHRVLLLWAELCDETGDFKEALAKSQAARTLAEHEGDVESSARAALLTLRCLCRCHRLDEAEVLATELLEGALIDAQPCLHAQALLCLGQARLTRGENPNDVLAVLDSASRVAEKGTLEYLDAPHRHQSERDSQGTRGGRLDGRGSAHIPTGCAP